MPKVSRESAEVEDFGLVEDRHAELDGYAVSFVTFRQDMDHAPMLKGLPDDRCQCPHWGQVLRGRWTVRYADREEIYEAGDAFYMPPGHVPVQNDPGTELLLVSPAAELRETEAVIKTNMQALQAG
jgi:hypothetical protein